MFVVEPEATTRALNGKMSSQLSIHLPARRHVGEESAEEGPRRSEKREPRLRRYPSLSCSVARQRGRGEIALIQRQSRSLLPCEFVASFSLPRQRPTGGGDSERGRERAVGFSFFFFQFFPRHETDANTKPRVKAGPRPREDKARRGAGSKSTRGNPSAYHTCVRSCPSAPGCTHLVLVHPVNPRKGGTVGM